MRKRLVSVLIAIALSAGFMPVIGFAENEYAAIPIDDASTEFLQEVEVQDTDNEDFAQGDEDEVVAEQERLREEAERERTEAEERRREAERIEAERREEQRRRDDEERAHEEELAKRAHGRKAADLGSVCSDKLTLYSFDMENALLSEEYSEVVYISTVNELMSIGGREYRDYCRYELVNDIDITGIEYKPPIVYSAEFNGNGHTIKGMTITQEQETKHYTDTWTDEDGSEHYEEWDETAAPGFLAGYDNRIYNLNLTDVNIDITVSNSAYISVVSPFGEQYAENCTVSGSVKVNDDADSVWRVCGIFNGSGCKAELSVFVSNCTAYGIYEGTDCAFSGSVSSDGGYAYGIDNSENCAFTGDVTAKSTDSWSYAYGIYDSTGCTFTGDVTATGSAEYGGSSCGIERSAECTLIGDVSMTGIGAYNGGAYGIRGSCTGCVFNGDVTAAGSGDYPSCPDYAFGICYDCAGCAFEGSVRSTDVFGIYFGCTGCSFDGSVTAVKKAERYSSYAYGIHGSENCIITGTLVSDDMAYGICESEDSVFSGKASSNDYIYGIRDSADCTFSGNLSSYGETYGIYGCAGCELSGDVTVESGGDSYSRAYGIFNSSGCALVGDTKNGSTYGGAAYGIYSYSYSGYGGGTIENHNESCIIFGNIMSNGSAYGIYSGVDCTASDFEEKDAIIGGNTGCSITGNITANNGSACGIESYVETSALHGVYGGGGYASNDLNVSGSNTDCNIYGNIVSNGGGYSYGICSDIYASADDYYAAYNNSVSSSQNIDCNVYGDIIHNDLTGSGSHCVFGIYSNVSSPDSAYNNSLNTGSNTGCGVFGNVNGSGSAYGIYNDGGLSSSNTDCFVSGGITADKTACGIYTGLDYGNGNYTGGNNTGCSIVGDIKSRGLGGDDWYGGGNAAGIYGSGNADCAVDGNVTAENGNAYATEDCSGYVSGAITQTLRGITLSVSAASPYMGAFKCWHCGAQTVSTDDLYDTVHCSYSYTDNNGETVTDYGYYYTEQGLKYSGDSISAKPNVPIGDPSIPTIPPCTYSVCVIDSVTGKPYANAAVYADGVERTTDKNGVAVFTDAPRIGRLTVYSNGGEIYSDDEFEAIPNSMNTVYVNFINIDKDDLFIGNNASVRLTGPKVNIGGYIFPVYDVPFDMDYDYFDTIKVAYNAQNKSVEVLIGGKYELADVAVDASSDSWKRTLEEFKEEYEMTKKSDYVSNTGAHGTMGISGDIHTRGFIEASVVDGAMQINGGLVVYLNGSLTYTHYFLPASYMVFELNGEIGGRPSWTLVNMSGTHPNIDLTGKFNASLAPGVGVGAGARKLMSAEIGLEGELGVEFTLPAREISESLTAELTASYYGAIYALGHPLKFTQRFEGIQLYPNFGADLMSASEPDTYTIDREYLNQPSLMAADEDTVNGSVYPYSAVKTAQLDDGRVIMVWTDDDTTRNSMDRTALYYSILENGTWSAATQIDNDGTADYDFALLASGSKAAIIWQNAETNLADNVSVDDNAKVVGLKYAEFDGASWGTAVNVTQSNAVYEYNPRVYYDGSTGYVAWAENADNTALPQFDTKESVYSASVSNGAATEKTMKFENLELIYGVEAGAGGKVACIVDKDGDYTTEDGILYVDGLECHSSDASVSGLHYADGGFCFSENGILRKSNGSSSYASEVYSGAENTSPKLLVNSSAKAVVYEVQDGFSSNLYASYYENGWTNPVKITDYTEKMRSWDAYLNSDGSVGVAAVLADISVGDDDFTQSVRLSRTVAEPIEDIEATYILIEDDITRGKTAAFEIGVKNDSRAKEFTVTLTGEKSGELYSGTVAADDAVSVSVTIPEDFEKQTITATVTAESINESDTANNSISDVFGAADLAVELRGSSAAKTGSASAVVTNNGCEDAENATLIVKDADGNVIAEESIGTLAAGEKKTVRFALDEQYYTFENEYDSNLIIAEITTTTDEAADYNNSTYYSIKAQTVQTVRLDTNSVAMEIGDTYTANVSVYHEDITDAPIYMTSSDEAVATVDEYGKITAVGNGTATISYMTPNALMSAKLTVYVREMGTPVITSAVYTDYSSEDEVYGEVNVTVDTSACLADGEKEQMITAVYDEDGTLLKVKTSEVTAAESNSVYISTSGKKPKRVKVMLWNSLAGMKPASYTAEAEVTEGE